MTARIAAVTLALGAAGCATIVQGSDQRVAFDTQPPGATVRADMQTCTTPCSLRLKRNRNVGAEIHKPGYATETVYLRYELDPWILGNIAFLPLAPLGGVVDIVSGAGFQLYPSFVAVPLQRTGEASPRAEEPPAPGATPDGMGAKPGTGDAKPGAPDAKPDAGDAKPEAPGADSDDEWKPIPDEL